MQNTHKITAQFVKHPMLGCNDTLQMLTRTANLKIRIKFNKNQCIQQWFRLDPMDSHSTMKQRVLSKDNIYTQVTRIKIFHESIESRSQCLFLFSAVRYSAKESFNTVTHSGWISGCNYFFWVRAFSVLMNNLFKPDAIFFLVST